MKKKLVALLLCLFATVITFSFGGCSDSCLRSCNHVRTAPTTDGVRERIKTLWDIDLPDNENLKLVNYAFDIGVRGDGDRLYVFDYNGEDADFNSLLNTEKDKKFEADFADIYKMIIDDFNSEYEFPGFSVNYYWLYMEKSSLNDSTLMDVRLYIIYFVDENELLIDFFKL